MTSTPTACPDCNNCGLPCLNEIHHPRQPDDRERAIRHYTASIVGEYVAGQVRRDFKAGADWGHARALKEMGAEVYRLKIALDQKEFTLQNTFNQWQERCEQLAAAELRAGEYEKCLETCLHDYNLSDTEFAKGEWTNAPMRKLISEVLAKHRRGGEGG